MPEMIQNGERLVKVSKKQAGKLRKFFIKALRTVAYVPGAIFSTLKDLPKTVAKKVKAKVEENMKEKEDSKAADVTKPMKDTKGTKTDKAPAKAKKDEDDKAKADDTKADTKKDSEKDKDSTKKQEPVRKPTTLGEMIEQMKDEKNQSTKDAKAIKENEPAKAVEFDKPSQPTKNTQEEPDTSILDTSIEDYGDLRKFASWEEYYNSFSEKERMRLMKSGDLLTDDEFNKARLFQAEETIRLCEAREAIRQAEKARLLEEENARQAQKDANKEEKKNLEARIKEIEEEQARLATESRRNKSQVRVLDKRSQDDEELKTNMEKITGKKEDEKTADKKPNEPTEQEPVKEDNVEPKSIDKQVDDIMQDINKGVYGDTPKEEPVKASTPQEPQVDEKKDVMANLANVVSQVVEQKPAEDAKQPNTDVASKDASPALPEASQDDKGDTLVSELANFDSPTKVQEEDNSKGTSTEYVSTDPNYPGTITIDDKDGVTTDWKTSPIENNAPQEPSMNYMGFAPETRAEVGQRAQEIEESSNGTLTFEDALAQATQEFSAEPESKGKTR